MKRFVSVLLVVAMVLCMGVVAYAENDLALKLTAADTEYCAGDTVKVEVSFANNTGISGSIIDVTYDADVLTVVGVEQGALLNNAFFQAKYDVPGEICADFAAIDALVGDAPAFVITFTVKEDAELGEFSLAASSDDTTDGAVVPNQLEVQSGSLTLEVVDFMWGDVDGNGVVDGLDATLILRFEAGTIELSDLPKPQAADTDFNGDIDGLDATLVLRYEGGIIDDDDVAELKNA